MSQHHRIHQQQYRNRLSPYLFIRLIAVLRVLSEPCLLYLSIVDSACTRHLEGVDTQARSSLATNLAFMIHICMRNSQWIARWLNTFTMRTTKPIQARVSTMRCKENSKCRDYHPMMIYPVSFKKNRLETPHHTLGSKT